MSGRHTVKQSKGLKYGTQGRMLAGKARVSSQRAGIRTVARQTRVRQPKENGFVDLSLTTYACDTTGTITLLATIAQGVSVNQRVGKKAKYVSIQMHGSVVSGSTTTFSDAAILIVYDKKPREALPAITDILVSASSRSFNNDAGSDRFVVIRRFDVMNVGNSATPATGLEAVDFDHFVPLRDLPIQFAAAGTGAIGDIEEGALYLVTVGSNAAGTTASTLAAGFRTRFKDV